MGKPFGTRGKVIGIPFSISCGEAGFLNARCASSVVQALVVPVWYEGPLCRRPVVQAWEERPLCRRPVLGSLIPDARDSVQGRLCKA